MTNQKKGVIIKSSQIRDGKKGEIIMLNSNKLRGKISEAGLNQRKLAQITGISENTISRKMQGHRCFDTDEIDKICAALNITNCLEKAEIFLSGSSQKRDKVKSA